MLSRWEIIKCFQCMRASLCACMHVCICNILKSSFISHSVIKISLPNLQRMFMAVKNSKKYGSHFKNNMATIADCSKIIPMF